MSPEDLKASCNDDMLHVSCFSLGKIKYAFSMHIGMHACMYGYTLTTRSSH